MNDSKTRRSPHKGTDSHRKNKYLFQILPTLLCCSEWIQRQEGNREKASRKPQWKNYDFTMFLSRITASHGIAVDWYLRVYWLLPLSIVDSFAEHRRFFWKAPTNTWASQSTSFPKGVFSLFQRTLFLFINWNSRQLGRSHTESADTVYKTLQSFWLTKRSCQRCWTQVICWAVPRYVLALLEDGHQWDGVSPLTGTLQERSQ